MKWSNSLKDAKYQSTCKKKSRIPIAIYHLGFPGGSEGKESVDLGSTLGLKGSPGEGNGYPLQCSCLENFMDEPSHKEIPGSCGFISEFYHILKK